MAKPVLYVPDYVGYYPPFSPMFDLVTGELPYDLDLIDAADAVLLTGGGDIDPSYYGQRASSAWSISHVRDRYEKQIIDETIKAKKPIIGVCRGAEWLAIAGGGSLIQDVSNHGMSHKVHTVDGKELFTSSLHHQMCDLSKVTHKMLAWSVKVSTRYLGEDKKELYPEGLEQEPEVFWVPKIRGFAIQGHPEALPLNHEFNVWMRDQLAYYLDQ